MLATISRILTHIEVKKFEQILSAWAEQAPAAPDEAIAIDGKTVRGSRRKEQAGVHLLAAYTHHTGVVVAQQAVGTKANEISAAPDLLASLDLPGKVVTGDAMYTQRGLCEQIVAAGGHYLVVCGQGQSARLGFRRYRPFFEPVGEFSSYQQSEKRQGRSSSYQVGASKALNEYLVWPHRAQVISIERRWQ